MPPRRRPRKRKVQTALSGKEFIESINDSFDEDAFGEACFPDMFDDLKEIDNLNKNLERYFMEFYERIVCGCCGLLFGDPAPNSPVNYSMFACEQSQLEQFATALEEFLQRFPILRNMMDKVLIRLLQSYTKLSVEMQQRVCKIIALFIKNKTYSKSKNDEFFLSSLKSDPNGVNVICDVLNAIKESTSQEMAFKFVETHKFSEILEFDGFDSDLFKQKMDWYMDYINKIQQQQREKMIFDELVEGFKQPAQLVEAMEKAKAICKDQQEWIQMYLKGALLSLDVAKADVQVCQQQFNQAIPELKSLITSVPLQGLLMDNLVCECYKYPQLNEMFKPCLMVLYTNEVIDGNVIIAWFERASANGKATFSKQMFRFVQWLKMD